MSHPHQPVLTSHELQARAREAHPASRTKRRFDVKKGTVSPSSTFKPGRSNKPKPNKVDRYSHERELQKHHGRSIVIVLLDGRPFTVKLLNSDRYTLLVVEKDNENQPAIIFKSGVLSIQLNVEGGE